VLFPFVVFMVEGVFQREKHTVAVAVNDKVVKGDVGPCRLLHIKRLHSRLIAWFKCTGEVDAKKECVG